MSTYDYKKICREVSVMQPWQVLALSAACAEKVSPLVYFLATPPTRALSSECLEFLWSSVLASDVGQDKASNLKKILETTPEWNCQDTDSIQSIVANVLSFFGWGLESMIDDSTSEIGEKVGFSHMLTTAESFDLAVESYESSKNISEMEQAEKRSQLKLVSILQTEPASSITLITSIKDEASSIKRMFEEKLPILCYNYVSDFVKRVQK